MRRLLITAASVLTAALLVPTGSAAAAPADDEFYRPVRGPSAPADHRFLQKTLRGEELPRHAFDIAAAEASRLPAVGGRWSLVGPTNIGGRIVDLALDPQRPDTVYVAAASGGLWRSTDAGGTFAPAWPDDLTQAMGSVAIDPNGTIYAGTGEANPGGGSITYTGTGVYKSTDRGRSWTSIGLRDSGAVGDIVIHPRDPRQIFVAATGSLFNPGGERGVYRSLDGGRSWTRVLAGVTDTTGATEVMFDPANPQRMYAVMWDHRRQPNLRTYSGVGSGVYRSVDGGTTWQRLDALAPAAADLGRIGIGIAPSDPNRLYAILGRGATSAQTFAGFLTSADGGDTWTRLPDDTQFGAQQSTFAWWFGKIWVDPDDARHLHVAGVGLSTSHDGGLTWTIDSETIHADQHAMAWDPRYPSRVYLGNDGGTYRSDTDGDGGWVKATYEPYTQFYSAAITPQDVSRVSGGTQDNGSVRSWGPDGFDQYVGGDGEENLINPTDVNNVFACFQFGNCFRSVDGGDTTTLFSNGTTSDRRNWFTPVQFDPADPRIMYYGGNRLNRSTDNGVTWTPISPDLTGGPGQDTYPFGTISTVAAAGPVIYVGTDDGRVWVTRDLGATWTLVLSGQPWVTRVVVDPRSAGTVYITLSGYRSGSPRPHIMVSRNFGASWTDLSGNLPQAPVNDLILARGGLLYAATDQGVFVSFGSTARWLRLGRALPLVPVDDLEYDPTHNRLVAATFGRGIYQLRTL
ncbi:MAG TPA: glycosyl hydrolase [Actinophytocola sp.]|uniref:WD40/YVTN/BNR-like repeat-containing protein n=1 Tax=Actinophytocola sp. TaxID=1872138 RepID=UPI002DDD92BA|nr:glycosyl hydrolase [Actinophytocola sp.]HEV2784111.1 glycosyl hydrolase [Actinophytocola sp.]